MKQFIKIFLFLIVLPVVIYSQDSAVIISAEMLSGSDEIQLGNMDGWLFKEGNNENLVKENTDAADWIKLKPSELSEKQADDNGRVEGWFRIKIKPEINPDSIPLGLIVNGWAAMDIYVNGNLVKSFGNTGSNGLPFEEYNPIHKFPIPVNFIPGKENLFSIHIVDYVSKIPPIRLKSKARDMNMFIMLTGPGFDAELSKHIKEEPYFRTVWITVFIILSLLFWLLYYLNSGEKNLRLIAVLSTLYILLAISQTIDHNPDISFNIFKLSKIVFWSLMNIILVMIPVLIVKLFNIRISRALKLFLILIILIGFISMFFPNNITSIFVTFSVIIICSYYIITSWKTLRGAQWAIVFGLIATLLLVFLLFTSFFIFPEMSSTVFQLMLTGTYLTFPLSLLVYVALRFREIIDEVREHAEQVVKMSEEKKEQALNQQKILEEEVRRQTAEIRTTLENLKSTQSQLIHSEKMASLGELTAGIAHEIQNPLNFVNNFSELNTELISELKDEIEKGNTGAMIDLVNDIEANEEKINHHGKRADAIVKGMLQHSRSGSQVREPADINALADEYLRLAYHGLRAKDKTFNAKMETDFDKSIGEINIVPQEIGRVILNLITNAFYAVTEKKKLNADGYEPAVKVSTKKSGEDLIISVKDNGNGIPSKVIGKIFQPFFTTKPAGQGTGLGLSLSYDIVKAHGGELKVETMEGEGSEFVILLPLV